MKDQSFSYRIVKVGGKAVSVALTALGLMAGAAQAADVWLGTSYSYATPNEVEGNNSRVIASFYGNGDKWDINNGYSIISVGMNNGPVATVNSSYAVSTSRSGDIFYGNTVNYVVDGNVLDAGYSVSRFGGNWSCNDGNSNACSTYWASAQRNGTYLANNFAQIIDNSSNNYHFGSGAVVNAQTRGERAYAQVNTWVYSNNPDDAYVTFSFNPGAAAQTDINNVAVNVNGRAYFDGNNTINGDVFTLGNHIRGSNVVFNSGYIEGGITYENAGTVYLNGTSQGGLDLDGSVNFGRHDGVLNLADKTTIYYDVTANNIANATVNFEGSGVVEGEVGPIKAINVQAKASRVQLNTQYGDTTVGSINYSADQATVEVYGQLTGNVNMNGHYSKLELVNRVDQSVQTAGMNGVLDFGMYKSNLALVAPDTYGKGTLEVGTNVNVTFSDDPTAGIKLTNADNATVVFAGNSTVTGNLGSADSTKHNTPYKIYAGAGTSTVTFNGHVFVGAGNLNVGPSNTTVKLNGATGDAVALTGNLVFGTGTPVSVEGQAYTTYGDAGVNGTWGNAGTVELADGKDITGSITTVTNGTGNMKFMGSSAYANNIGTQALKLNSVVFNAAATSATSTIAGNVWASDVTIGNGTNTTTATLTAGEHQLGDKLTLAGANTTLNLLGATTTKNTDGTLANAGASTVTVGDNGIVTNGATLNFAVNAGNVEAHTGAIVAPTQGSLIQTTGGLTMNGAEKVNVTLLGSMRDGQTIKLIDAVSTNSNALNAATLVDNSFVIETATSRVGGDLVMTATRANNQYIAKSATTGHFSNAAALRLGTLAANGDTTNNPGTNYTSDMQTVFNKLDLNEWGFGNNEANLAKQVKRLAPISNGSIAQSAIDAGNLALNTMGNRMASLRADKAPVGIAGAEVEGRDGQWIKLVGNNSKQNAKGDYDGYSANTSGLVWGADTRIDKDALLGVGLSATNTRVSQSGFRSGDSNSITSYEIAGYGAYQFTEEFYGEGSLSYARHNITGSRLTALDRVAKADYSANQLTGRLGIGYRFVLDNKQTLTPMLNLESSSLSSGAYTETGADALNLKLNSQKLTRTRTSLGLRYLAENTTDAGTVYRPELTAAIYRDGSGTTKDTVAAFEGDLTGNTFSTTNAVLGRSGYNLAAGVSILNSKTSLVQLHLGYDHREGFSSTSARIKARWDF